ncbi:hypothetical protein ACUSIJ_24660 [Pseudochelatococcus sp. B33]
MTDIVKQLRMTPLYEGHGEESSLPEFAADTIEALQARVTELECARAKAWYDVTFAENRRRFAACDDAPRIFIRHLRAPDKSEPFNPDDPLFEISEGRATELLAEREARAVERATTPLADRIRALEEALRPFGETYEAGIDDDDIPTLSIWEHPAAGFITIADLRHAHAVLKGEGETNARNA